MKQPIVAWHLFSNTFDEFNFFEKQKPAPMTEGDIKQQLSYHYLGAIVAKSGCKMEKPITDYGVDAAIEWIDKVETVNGLRYSQSGITIDVQLKCTTESRIRRRNDLLFYDLDEKNYNDLVRRFKRRKTSVNAINPLILVLHVLPDNPASWLVFQEKGFFFAGEQYWLYPNAQMEEIERSSSFRISIPTQNKVGLDFCRETFKLLHPIFF